MTTAIWRRIFLLGALWNFLGAGVAFWDLEANATQFYLTPESALHPVLFLNLRIVWWTVITFGFGYLLVAWKPIKNSGILAVAIPGKLAVGYWWVKGYWTGLVSEIAFAGGVGDIIFALVFLWFLIKKSE